MGSLIDELQRREAAARAEAEELRGRIAEPTERLARAEERLSRLVITRETVDEVLSEAGADAPPAVERELTTRPRRSPVIGVVMVPPWRAGLEVSVLPQEYRDLLKVAEDAGRPLRAAQIAAAAGAQYGPGEGGDLASKLKRLTAWSPRSSSSSGPTWSAASSWPAPHPPATQGRLPRGPYSRLPWRRRAPRASTQAFPVLLADRDQPGCRRRLPRPAGRAHRGPRRTCVQRDDRRPADGPREVGAGHLARPGKRGGKPVLVVNGDDDTMLPTISSFHVARMLPDVQLSIYPDSGHGGIFQHHDLFVAQGLGFLRD